MTALVTTAEWAEHRRQAMQAMPAELVGRALPDVLMPFQAELLSAISRVALVVAEKSRRTGATWGLGSEAVLTSAAQKPAGGMDTLYLGYNLDMAREFIDVCAMWAKAFDLAASAVEEFLFADHARGAADRSIQSFRIRFASGFEIVALSSRPRSLRGRQGLAILDEFAFHDEAEELLKAAMALLIWGGKVVVISTHNGVDNPFNQLITEIREKRRPGEIVRCTFDEALEQGLYQRVCLVTGKAWSPDDEAAWRADIRGYYGDGAGEELDCIPSQGSGVYLSRAVIEACMDDALPVLRLRCPDGFELQSEAVRRSFVADWLEENVAPVIAKLDVNLRHSYGFDFARSGDLSVYVPACEERTLTITVPFVIEMRNVPFRQQEQAVFWVGEKLPRFSNAKHDARGNGQFLAEYAVQKWGPLRVEAVMMSQPWYLEHMPPMKARFEDRTIRLPKDADLMSDLRQIKLTRGIPMVPDTAQTKGTDGGQRHGDFAVGLCLANAAAESDHWEAGYRSGGAGGEAEPGAMRDEPEGDARGRDWWKSPLGRGMRGSV